MKQFIKGRWFPLIAVTGAVTIVAVVMALFGWKITYAPNLENSWDAIGAVANWAGVIVGAVMIPLFVAFLQHKWDNDKQEIADSNLALLEDLRRTQEKMQEDLRKAKEILPDRNNTFDVEYDIRENIQSYIKIAMSPSTKEIADYLRITQESLLPILEEMKEQRIIWTKYIRGNTSDPDCRWKLLKK